MQVEAVHDYLARLDGSTAWLWEPLWQLRTELRPVEQELLTCWALRRLHFIHHAGPAYLCTPHTYSRLQHTLGVFSLVSYFCPDDTLLRVAALLHDVGHAPFSHALESLTGVDHHRQTSNRILSSPIADILQSHHLAPQEVLACIRGEPPNLLRNQDNVLHLDHLDSWVRSAQAAGILPVSVPDLLTQLWLDQPYLDMPLVTAEQLVDLIIAEVRFHCSSANLGTNTILQHLVQQVLVAEILTIETLVDMIDSTLEQILLTSRITAQMARRLWFQPYKLRVNRLVAGDAPPSGSYIGLVHRLYLSMPLVEGQPVTQVSPQAAQLVADVEQLYGAYLVTWVD